MGKTVLLLLGGFSLTFILLSKSKSDRLLDAANLAIEHFAGYSAANAASSGANMALNRLYLDSSWRTGYTNLLLNQDTINVSLADISTDSLVPPFQIRITSEGRGQQVVASAEVMVFDGNFHGFAVWAKDSVGYVTTKDSLGNTDPMLQMEYAPFMPQIAYSNLVAMAASQGHVQGAPTFEPADGYPNGSFYNIPTVPNVTHVTGNLKVKANRSVYGIFVVEGNVVLEDKARVEGILYAPNTTSSISNKNPQITYVTGGILTWGSVSGTGNQIIVQLQPGYMRSFVNSFLPKNPPIRVLSWK